MAGRMHGSAEIAGKSSAFSYRRQNFRNFFLRFSQNICALPAHRKQPFCDAFIERAGRISAVYPVFELPLVQFVLFFKGISAQMLPQAQVMKLSAISVE